MGLHTQFQRARLCSTHQVCHPCLFPRHCWQLLRQPFSGKLSAVADSNSHDHGENLNNGEISPSNTSNSAIGPMQRWQQQSRHIQKQLQDLGAAGVVAYGIFNTLYYTLAFLLVWSSIGNAPSGQGYSAAARKAAEVFAVVWAGSQVTKLVRAGAAVACAPLLERVMRYFGVVNRQTAYLLIVVCCVGFAAAVMALVISWHA